MGPEFSDGECDNLNRMILEVVLCDFESFESIVSRVTRQTGDNPSSEDAGTVSAALLALIDVGLVGAYLIHADPPYFTVVAPTLETVQRFWFMITESGKSQVQHLAKQRAWVVRE
jgi:hypothetical protein